MFTRQGGFRQDAVAVAAAGKVRLRIGLGPRTDCGREHVRNLMRSQHIPAPMSWSATLKEPDYSHPWAQSAKAVPHTARGR